MTRFSIVGGGWRTEFFLRIAQQLPEEFEVLSMLVRNPVRADELIRQFGVKTVDSLDDLLVDKPDFVVTSLSWSSNPVFIRELVERGIAILSETPPAPDVAALCSLTELVKQGARIQVAEQYIFQPEHAARMSEIQSGKLGDVFQAQVSVCHGYHGISLIRRFLGLTFEPATIRAKRLPEVVIGGPDRNGRPPEAERLDRQTQLIAHLDFGDRQGVFDFVGSMYHSYIRSHRVLVRGPKGEINHHEVRYLADYKTPIQYRLNRVEAGHTGNLDGHFLQGILAGEHWAYRNPFPFARLMDDEIAIATCLRLMGDYAKGGPDFYSLAEACQDHYLSILMEQSADQNSEITSVPQPWSTH